MSDATSHHSLEDVLDAFSVERESGRDTLERYLRQYPQYAAALIDLSREIERRPFDESPLSSEDRQFIDSAWRRHTEAGLQAVADPFAALTIAALREVARKLDVPRQVITAFREHKVILTSVPRHFMARFAEAISSTFDKLLADLTVSAATPARSYKADVKPSTDTQVTFEQLLIDAGVPIEKRAELLADRN